jgi:hypothetical protein
MTCTVKTQVKPCLSRFTVLNETNIGRVDRSSWCKPVETNLQKMNYAWCRGRHDNSQLRLAKERE